MKELPNRLFKKAMPYFEHAVCCVAAMLCTLVTGLFLKFLVWLHVMNQRSYEKIERIENNLLIGIFIILSVGLLLLLIINGAKEIYAEYRGEEN